MLKKLTQKRSKKGFTLVELIVVIAILGILAAIAVPRLSGFRDSAKISADTATAESIVKAAELYSVTHNLADEAEVKVTNKGILIGNIDEKHKLIEDDLLEPDLKSQVTGDDFALGYTKDDGFTVESDGHKFYPEYVKKAAAAKAN